MTAFFKLGTEDKPALESVLTAGNEVGQFRRAQALLWLDEGISVQNVAHLLRVSRQTVYNWVSRFRADKNISPIRRIGDAPRSGRPCTALGITDPLIDKIIDKDPRDFGYRSSVWTSDLLVRYLSDTYGIGVSKRSVSYALKRLGIRWKFPRYDLIRRSPTWRQAKGGSSEDYPIGSAP